MTTFAEVVRVNLIERTTSFSAELAKDGALGGCRRRQAEHALRIRLRTSATATQLCARDLASRQIRVNTVAPGIMETPMLGRLRSDIREGLAATVPHPKRLGVPDDYARLTVEMLENPYLNGQTVRLDGAIRMAPR